ncbi:hypothetical protein J7L01_07150 [bacterium]|nr:hypothetical protein [bacterium]
MINITIENNQVIVNLDEFEFPVFETMFNNLELDKFVQCDFRDFPWGDGEVFQKLLPMHLCRTIGEANLAEDPFATITLYPFWKYGFAFGAGEALTLDPSQDDPHKKAVIADEMGMGFCAWAMEEIFDCEYWADTSALIKKGAVFPTGTKRPDFVCGFKDGSLGIFEAKGTTGTAGGLSGALADGKIQTAGISATDPISMRVVVGVALGGEVAKVIMLDPEPENNAIKTNLTAKLVAEAAKEMRTTVGEAYMPPEGAGRIYPSPTPAKIETIFRGPDGEIKLTNQFKEEKGHGWLGLSG